MADVVVGETPFEIRSARSLDGLRWTAQAIRLDDGSAFGPAHESWTEGAAVERARRWLQWQADHVAALAALQEAEHAYHRARAGDAFAAPSHEDPGRPDSRTRLAEVDAARARLDEVRRARPE